MENHKKEQGLRKQRLGVRELIMRREGVSTLQRPS